MYVMSKVKLVSDFREWYDHMFDRDGIEFHRPSRHLGRRESLNIMDAAGLRVPSSGPIERFWSCGDTVVVHTDEYAHRGDGKVLLDLFNFPVRSEIDRYSGMTCVKYMVGDGSYGRSYRHLWVGDMYFGFTYQSYNWRSNHGDVSVGLDDCVCKPRHVFFDYLYPILAFDTVTVDGKEYYIDMNTSPGIPKDIGLSATEVVNLIKRFIFK
jgi:hypothetical protein